MLLALFSSPTTMRTKIGKHSLPPLQLMKEIQSCIENIPHRYREIRPAARFPEDMLHVVRELSPRMLQFSGHGDAIRHGAQYAHAKGLSHPGLALRSDWSSVPRTSAVL